MAIGSTTGTERTRRFYDELGWTTGVRGSVDRDLFGTLEDGPIRRQQQRLHVERIQAAVASSAERPRLLECGCGGNPQRFLLPLCGSYVGTDFSERGVRMARERFAEVRVPHEFRVADACSLPFSDGEFDAAYSAHMLYHIDEPQAQACALDELVRVIKPGGVLVLVVANPRPLLFPFRLAKRVVADTPVVGRVAKALRSPPPVPYRPMPLGWMRRRLRDHGTLAVWTGAVPSTWFNQNVSEAYGVGRQLWRGIAWMEQSYPRLSARLGNYVTVVLRKS